MSPVIPTLTEVASRALTSVLTGGPAGASSSVTTASVSLAVLRPTLFRASTLIRYRRAGSRLRRTVDSLLELSLALTLCRTKWSPRPASEEASRDWCVWWCDGSSFTVTTYSRMRLLPVTGG